MPVSTKRGNFGFEAASNGIAPESIPTVEGGAGPFSDIVVVIISCALGLDYASDPTITLQMFPSGDFSNGTDINGNISVTETFTRIDGNEWAWSTGQAEFEDGFMNTAFRGVINIAQSLAPNATIQYEMQLLCADSSSYTENPLLPPVDEPVESGNLSYDAEIEEGEVTISFTHTDPDRPDGYIVQLAEGPGVPAPEDWFDWGFVENQVDITDYEFEDWAFGAIPQSWWYRVIPYWNDTLELAPASTPILVTWDADLPDIAIIGSGGIDLGGAATITLQGDPSGLYTLVLNKTNDTLYERAGSEDTVDVKIPNPFFKTGFLE